MEKEKKELGTLMDTEYMLYAESVKRVSKNIYTADKKTFLDLVDIMFMRKERYETIRERYLQAIKESYSK